MAFASVERTREYQREWRREWSRKNPGAAAREQARYRSEHLARVRARHRLRQLTRMAFRDSLKVGGCVDCGNKNLTVLDFDHIRDVKVGNIGEMGMATFSTIERESLKCEVRCANCHRIVTARRRVRT